MKRGKLSGFKIEEPGSQSHVFIMDVRLAPCPKRANAPTAKNRCGRRRFIYFVPKVSSLYPCSAETYSTEPAPLDRLR